MAKRITSPKRTNVRDLTGRRFGRLKVEEETKDRASNGAILWLCRCRCGNTSKVMGSNLLKADDDPSVTRSCGCRRRKPPKKGKAK